MSTSRAVLFTALAIGVVTAALMLPGVRGGEGQAKAARSDVVVAESVCEAHELRARKREDPHLEIEIPREFDRPYPSESACRSHELAWDEDAPGPQQPIPFSHAHHAGEYEIPCLYCHSGTDRSRAAGVPSVELCMGCHSQFAKEYDELEGIQILKQHWEEGRSIEWQRVHWLPEYVQFRHNRHIAAGVDCRECHGPVEEMDKVYLVPETRWVYGMPAFKPKMGWCMSCHWERGATDDCLSCHH
jgi:hypothetical protein